MFSGRYYKLRLCTGERLCCPNLDASVSEDDVSESSCFDFGNLVCGEESVLSVLIVESIAISNSLILIFKRCIEQGTDVGVWHMIFCHSSHIGINIVHISIELFEHSPSEGVRCDLLEGKYLLQSQFL